MPQSPFNHTLERELEETATDFNIQSVPQQFAIWVGKIVFGLDAREMLDERILWSDETLCVFRADDAPESCLVLALCEITLDGSGGFEPVDLLGRWEAGWEEGSGLTDAGADFVEAQEEDRTFSVTHLFFTSRDLTADETKDEDAAVVALGELARRYARLTDPGAVTEPDVLEVKEWDRGESIGQDVGDEDDPSAVRAHVRTLPLTLIHAWVAEYRNGLFASNLRYRLAGTGDSAAVELDHAIKRTVRERPRRMLIQNNGITITCERIDLSADGTVATLVRPQIVNGCQTSWAIYDEIQACAYRGQGAPEGLIVAKIIETADRTLASAITSASNRQNAIQLRDERGTDPRQADIALVLANHSDNRRIHWDYRRGAIANLLAKPSGQEYLVRQTKGALRTIDNMLGGQLMLAMAGAVLDAKNRPKDLFETDSRLYDMAFGFDLDAQQRFGTLAPTAFLRSGPDGSVDAYAEDVLFGFVVYQHALAAFKWLHAEALRDLRKRFAADDEQRVNAVTIKTQHEFVKFWTFDVVRLIHRITEAWVRDYGRDRTQLRAALVGDLTRPQFLDPPFQPQSVRERLFHPDARETSPAVLDPVKPSDLLPTLGSWFVKLEHIGAGVIARALENDSSATARTLVLSRRSTYDALSAAVEEVISSHLFVKEFPDPTNGA